MWRFACGLRRFLRASSDGAPRTTRLAGWRSGLDIAKVVPRSEKKGQLLVSDPDAVGSILRRGQTDMGLADGHGSADPVGSGTLSDSDHALRRGWVTDKVADLMFRSTTMSVSTILGSWITCTNFLEIQVKVAVRQTYVSPDALGDCIPCGPAWVTLERRGTTNDACHICHTPPCAQARASWQLWARGRTSTCGSTCCVTTLAIMYVAGVPT